MHTIAAADNAASFGNSEIALLIFFAIFVGIVIRTLLRPREEIERWSQIPLDDQKVQQERTKRPE